MGNADEAANGAGLASLILTRQIYRYLILHGVMSKDVALELVDLASIEAEAYQRPGNTSLQALARSARFHIEATHIALRTFDPTP